MGSVCRAKILKKGELKMNRIAKFHKVSFEQFLEDWVDTFGNTYQEEKIIEIYNNIKLPKRKTTYSAGHDISIPFSKIVLPQQTLKIPTGLRCEIDSDYVMLVFPRSSLGIKKNMYITNTIPVIDADYFEANNEGHIFLSIKNGGDKILELNNGDAIVQAIFLQYGVADEEEILNKRMGGVGSTGL